MSFSKTNSPFLREARYFGSGQGGLSLLSNVYDLSFSFKRRKANTMFYPGCIINFVLLDWGKRWVDEPAWIASPPGSIGPGSITHFFDSGLLGDSDPHKEGTMSNIMGMGGYFLVKSVEYNLGQTPGEFEIKVDTKFLGTDAPKKLSRTTEQIKNAVVKQECADIFDAVALRHNELLRQNPSGSGDPIALIGTIPASKLQPSGTKVPEVVADGMTSTDESYRMENGKRYDLDAKTRKYVHKFTGEVLP